MKFLVFFLFLNLPSSLIDDNHPSQENDNYEFSGIYEVVVNNGSSSYFDLIRGGNKSLIRLHLYRFPYPNGGYRPAYNTLTKKSVLPRAVVLLFEEYPNKRGKGIPKRMYFMANSYETTTELRLDNIKIAGKDDGDGVNIENRHFRKFVVPKSQSGEFKIHTPYYNETFEKKGNYDELPSIFNPFFKAVLRYTKEKTDDKIVFGQTFGTDSGKLFFNDISSEGEVAEASFVYNNSSEFGLDNPSEFWLNSLKSEIYETLTDDRHGAHTVLPYLPHLKKIKVGISRTTKYEEKYDEVNHFFDIKINRSTENIDYSLEKTNNAAVYEKLGLKADSLRLVVERERRDKEREEYLRAEEIRQQEERLAAEKALKEFMIIMAKTTPTGEPTEGQMRLAITNGIIFKKSTLDQLGNIELDNSSTSVHVIGKLVGEGFKAFELNIADFKKYDCKKIEGKTYYECDYYVKMKYGGSWGKIFEIMNNPVGEVQTASFEKVNQIWMLTD